MSFYQQKNIKAFIFPETSTYLTPLNGTIITANPATYPWFERISLMPEGFDFDLPIRLREKRWGVGSGKHPSHIINTVNEPIEFSIDMEMQDARFIALATGTTSSAGLRAAVTTITTVAASAITQADYFLIYCIDGSGHCICNAVWFDIDAAGTGAPSITGATNIEVDIASTDTAAQVATKLKNVLDAEGNYGAGVSDTVVTVTNANNGAVPTLRDGAAATDFTFTTSTFGSSTQTVTEATGSSLPNFGMHVEYDNGSEDIAVDLFGCVVVSEEVSIDYEEKVIKETVTIRCPYFALGNISTCPPPKRSVNVNVWQEVVEDTGIYLLMSGSTDKTPAIVTAATLKIENDIELYPEIGVSYRTHVVTGTRTVSLNIIGFTQTNDLWTIWATDTWDNANGYYTTNAARLNTNLRIQRTATYDLWTIAIYNWLITEFEMKVFPIDDKIMGIDITLEGATPNSSGYIISSLSIVDYICKIYYNVANS